MLLDDTLRRGFGVCSPSRFFDCYILPGNLLECRIRTQFAADGTSPLPSAQELRELIELKTELNRMYQDVAATRTTGPTVPPQQQ